MGIGVCFEEGILWCILGCIGEGGWELRGYKLRGGGGVEKGALRATHLMQIW